MTRTYLRLRSKLHAVQAQARLWIRHGAEPTALLTTLTQVHHLIHTRQLSHALTLLDHLLITYQIKTDTTSHASNARHAA